MIHTLTSTLQSWLRARASFRALSRLSDHELTDLGIGRDDIAAVVRQGSLSAATRG